jgi:hypothetical protein
MEATLTATPEALPSLVNFRARLVLQERVSFFFFTPFDASAAACGPHDRFVCVGLLASTAFRFLRSSAFARCSHWVSIFLSCEACGCRQAWVEYPSRRPGHSTMEPTNCYEEHWDGTIPCSIIILRKHMILENKKPIRRVSHCL